MKMFIIGSYRGKRKEEIEENVLKAVNAGKELLKKGHLPFVPQSMFAYWERDIPMDLIMKVCFKWVEECDAVLVLNLGLKKSGTNRALQVAKRFKKKIYYSINKVPNS